MPNLIKTLLFAHVLLKQGYIVPMLQLSLQKFYGRHHNLVDRNEIAISQITMDLLINVFFPLSLSRHLPNLTGCMSNTAVSYKKTGTAFPSPAHYVCVLS